MNDQPSVSVIIPTYNRWPTVCDAIDSVLNQTHPNTQCIVVDDCSTDGSWGKLQNQYGNKIQLLRNDSNQEKSYSRNRGVQESEADYVCFLDSDDVLLPDAIAIRLEVFNHREPNSGVVYGISLSVSNHEWKQAASDDRQSWRERAHAFQTLKSVDDYMQNAQGMRTNSYLISRTEMLRYGMYNEALTNREDIELFIRLFCYLEFYSCEDVVSLVRDVSSESAGNNWNKIIAQGYQLSDNLEQNAEIKQKLGHRLRLIKLEDHKALLRALYRGRFFKDYRRVFLAGFKRHQPFVGFKFYRRFLVSLFARNTSS